MDDLIVIILTLIIAGAGALGQLKKKKRTQTNSGANKNTPNTFWDLIQGESNVTQEEEVAEFEESDFESETGFDAQDEVKKRNPVYSSNGNKEGASEIANDFVEKTKKSKIKSGAIKDFSLRKAVIYNEILNRKYT